jgi:hypothetical protein
VKQHGSAAFNNAHNFSSASNEAVIDGLVSLSPYKMVDWILGKESTVNETFSTAEQTLVSNYLKQGGNLFVSGSEIGWDLDNNGSATDKSFYNNYLKASYAADAPNSQASTWYKSVSTNTAGVFSFADTCLFDNGNGGTYNVDYPDVITSNNGSSPCLAFTNAGSNIAGINYSGLFLSGTAPAKLVYITFPFETITSLSRRNSMFRDVWNYFFGNIVTTVNENESEAEMDFYPNPATNEIGFNEVCDVSIYDISGKLILRDLQISQLNIKDLARGIYIIEINSKERSARKKLLKQ